MPSALIYSPYVNGTVKPNFTVSGAASYAGYREGDPVQCDLLDFNGNLLYSRQTKTDENGIWCVDFEVAPNTCPKYRCIINASLWINGQWAVYYQVSPIAIVANPPVVITKLVHNNMEYDLLHGTEIHNGDTIKGTSTQQSPIVAYTLDYWNGMGWDDGKTQPIAYPINMNYEWSAPLQFDDSVQRYYRIRAVLLGEDPPAGYATVGLLHPPAS